MNHLANMLQENADSIKSLISKMVQHRLHVGRAKGFDSSEVLHLDKKIRKLNDDYQSITGTRLKEADSAWSPEGIKKTIARLRDKQQRLGREKGFNSSEVGAIDAQIYDLTQELRNLTGRYRGEAAPNVDGEDEFDFDIDSGNGEELPDVDADEPEFDDVDGQDDTDYDTDFSDDEDEDDDEDEEDFDDEDEEDFDDEDGVDVQSRLDNLEDKLNSLLSKFAEVLATDLADDEDDGEDFDDEDDEDSDEDEDDDVDFSDEDDVDYRESAHEDLMEDDPDSYPDSVVEQIILLGNLVRTMLSAGDGPTDRVLTKAIEYLRDNPELESDTAAVALSALIRGDLEQYYRRLKDNYPTIRNQF